jgi:hypothetical protein
MADHLVRTSPDRVIRMDRECEPLLMVTCRLSEAQPFGYTSIDALEQLLAQNATSAGPSMNPEPVPKPRLRYVTVFSGFVSRSAVSELAKLTRTGVRLRAAIANAC